MATEDYACTLKYQLQLFVRIKYKIILLIGYVGKQKPSVMIFLTM